jgi:hypothetical protein
VEKLEEIIRRYPLIFDPNEVELATNHRRNPAALQKIHQNIDTTIDLFQQEIDFLLKVFLASKPNEKENDENKEKKNNVSRVIDLTPAVFLSVDMINSCYYRLMKHRLQTGETRLITKTEADQFTRHWITFPLKEMLRMKVTGSSSGDKKGVDSSSSSAHIVLDINRQRESDHSDLLVKSVQLRLHQLIGAFYQLSIQQSHPSLPPPSQSSPSPAVLPNSFPRALQMAVINGDDLSVALLLKLAENALGRENKMITTTKKTSSSGSSSPASPSVSSVKTLLSCIESATQLGYLHIRERLVQAIVSLPMNHLLATTTPEEVERIRALSQEFMANHSNNPEEEIEWFNEFLPEKKKNDQKKSNEEQQDEKESSGSDSESASPLCDIASVDLKDLSFDSFEKDFVRLNRPLLIRLPTPTTITPSSEEENKTTKKNNNNKNKKKKNTNTIISEESLLDEFFDQSLVLGRIPYSSLFGMTEVSE